MNTAESIWTSLENAIHVMADDPAPFCKNPGRDFTHTTKLSFSDVLWFPILMEQDTVNRELLKFFSFDLDRVPTQSAYIQSRAKLLPDTFRHLLNSFNDTIPPATYKNRYVLYAVDGSGFNLFYNPLDSDTYNPPSGKSEKGNNEIHLVAAYRISDHLFSDAVIQPGRKKNEYAAICELIDRCPADDGHIPIIIADRGFPSANMYAHAKERGVKFLVRAKGNLVERILRNDRPDGEDEYDITVTRIYTRSNSKKNRSHPESPEIYRFIGKDVQFDYISPGSDEEYPVSLRVMRVKIAEDSYENLITNLDPEEFPLTDMKALYYSRWGIETAFRYLKHTIGASSFHSKKLENVTHEIWARFILSNCCAAVSALATARQPEDAKHTYRINFTMAIKNTHDYLIKQKDGLSIDIIAIIESYICPVRKDRIFERRPRYQTPLKFSYRH